MTLSFKDLQFASGNLLDEVRRQKSYKGAAWHFDEAFYQEVCRGFNCFQLKDSGYSLESNFCNNFTEEKMSTGRIYSVEYDRNLGTGNK
jgi:hypothetical protein